MIQFKTNRLIIREHRESDLQDYHKWISDPDVMSYVDWETSNLEETQKDFTETLNEIENPDRTNYFFAITEKATQNYVGAIGFAIKKKQHNGGIAECGYFLLTKYWRKGIAVEALTGLIEYGFSQLNIHKISASCYKENFSSERVMQKCKFIKEGELRKERYHHNKWHNRLLYSILKEDWENTNKHPSLKDPALVSP